MAVIRPCEGGGRWAGAPCPRKRGGARPPGDASLPAPCPLWPRTTQGCRRPSSQRRGGGFLSFGGPGKEDAGPLVLSSEIRGKESGRRGKRRPHPLGNEGEGVWPLREAAATLCPREGGGRQAGTFGKSGEARLPGDALTPTPRHLRPRMMQVRHRHRRRPSLTVHRCQLPPPLFSGTVYAGGKLRFLHP